MIDNPSLVISTLDGFLDHEVSLVLYGRGALQLGFEEPRDEFAGTQDVDSIIRLSQLDELMADEQFWGAVEKTNEALSSQGLYITHFFQADQVFLRPGWEDAIATLVRPATKHLRLYRPATIDLILTKMMRGDDAQDMHDAAFLIRHDGVTRTQLEEAFATVQIPDIQELHDAFDRARPVVLGLAST